MATQTPKETSKNYEKDIYDFINSYFQEIDNISDFHINFFIKNNIKTIDLDMLILYKFIFQAFQFLKNNLEIKFSNFIYKLYLDIKALLEYLKNFEKKSNLTDTIFENRFLINLPEYKLLKQKIKQREKTFHLTSLNISSLESQIKFFNPQTKEDQKELKHLRGRLVDAIHYNAKAKEDIALFTIEINKIKNEVKTLFFNEFIKAKHSYISKLKLVINTKLYYFNKQVWIETNQDKKALNYFDSLGIKHMDLNVYIKNYLKHIDTTKSNNSNELEQIEEVLRELDG